MNEKDIKEKLKKAIWNLFINQKDIFEFTPESGVTEWNLTHHLAFEIQKEFPEYQLDIELTKPSFNNRRPDIILHERQTHNNNFLVIEVKCQKSPLNDINKIKDYWFDYPLRYKFGASTNIENLHKYNITIIKNQDRNSKREE
ncbi:hypothetical protein LCGC14_0703060 [marine sediment metagenome]|uniref:Type I restriction enzyme R protein N-terminal domain-containing protein n=1 Tax=marine sediment metagenome TaxID=412755 RepID=A0A0F9TPZ2_9ZZZZ